MKSNKWNTKKEVNALYEAMGDYDSVGKKFGVSGMVIWKIIHKDYYSPTVTRQLFPTEKRYRRCGEFTKDDAKDYDNLLKEQGKTTTDILNEYLKNHQNS